MDETISESVMTCCEKANAELITVTTTIAFFIVQPFPPPMTPTFMVLCLLKIFQLQNFAMNWYKKQPRSNASVHRIPNLYSVVDVKTWPGRRTVSGQLGLFTESGWACVSKAKAASGKSGRLNWSFSESLSAKPE